MGKREDHEDALPLIQGAPLTTPTLIPGTIQKYLFSSSYVGALLGT